MLKKLVWVVGIFVLLLILACAGAYYYLIPRSLPQTDGRIRLAGLQAQVTVFRDPWGVPHIYAANTHDLFMAQGFVQAQDRLWQMESNRRVAAGRLSEVIGSKTLDLDRLLRTFGLMRAAEGELAACPEAELAILKAFAGGVNAYIHLYRNRLPIEFRLLRVEPEPWRPEHSIAWAKVMALLGSKNWQEEIVRAALVGKLGRARAAALLGLNRPGTPNIIPPGLDLTALRPDPSGPLQPVFPRLGGASNNWVVHGSRTTTGAPLLANDMHLPVSIPCVWYEMHLAGGPYDVVGLTLPGVPLVIAGHNQEVAWGITFAYTDVQDLYTEKMHPTERGKYLYKGRWVPARRLEERIRVKGQDAPVVHEVWETCHGPIISQQIPGARKGDHALALRWSAHEPGGMVSGVRLLNLARNWTAFKAAAQRWSEPPINLVYADRRGNIGYVLGSRVPLRALGHGQGPHQGWTGGNEWEGYLHPLRKPFLFNPPQGYAVTANHRVTGRKYPHYLAVDYASGHRAARIEEMLRQKDKVSKEDFAVMQGDLKCLPAASFLEAIGGIQIRDPEARDLVRKLGAWDQVLGPDSMGGAIYGVLFYRLMENTLRDELGDTTDLFYGIGLTPLEPLNRFVEHSRTILLRLLENPRSPWFDNIRTQGRETLQDILEKSLKETASFLKVHLGPDPSQWRWGRLHTVDIKHPLGQVKPLDRIFNLGPYEGGGHFATVWQSAVMPGMHFELNGWTASNRHIYDLKDWDQSLGAIVPGQSGMLGSDHYQDQVDPWLRVEHHPLYYSRSKVETGAKHVLILTP